MYMHSSVNIFPWNPCSLPTIFLIYLVFDGVGKNLIYECLFILYCFFPHSYLVNLLWTKVHFDKLIDSFVFSHAHGCILNAIEEVRIPFLCILYSNATKIQIYAQTLGSFLISFKTLFWLLSSYVIVSNLLLCVSWLLACFIRWSFLHYVIFLQSFILNMVWLPPNTVNWINAHDFTHFMRNAHLGEELILYWPYKFLHPFWQLLPMGEKFRGFKGNGFYT
jgi:hypothetical protein